MESRYEQVVESLLRQILARLGTNDKIESLLRQILRQLGGIEEDIEEVDADVQKLIPEPSAISATLTLTANK